MSPTGGYLKWDHDVGRRPFYFAGRTFVKGVPEGFGREPSPGATLLPTHGGSHKVHLPYIGTSVPDQLRAYRFSFDWLANDQDDFYSLLAYAASVEIHDFCPFLWVVDRFAPVVSGTTYSLSRRRAVAVISGLSESTHPTVWTADDTPHDSTWPSALGAQTWQAPSDADEVLVRYLPLHRVVVAGISERLAQPNELRLSIQLEEALQPA